MIHSINIRTWTREKLERNVRKIDGKLKDLFIKDRYSKIDHKNALRNCQTPPVKWEILEQLLPGWKLSTVNMR